MLQNSRRGKCGINNLEWFSLNKIIMLRCIMLSSIRINFHITSFFMIWQGTYEVRERGVSSYMKGFVSMKVMWYNYLIFILNNCDKKLYTWRVWESSSSAKIAPELQIHEISPWSSSTVDLEFQRVFGTAPYLPSSLWHIGPTCHERMKNKSPF
jgi:hypothetical protein